MSFNDAPTAYVTENVLRIHFVNESDEAMNLLRNADFQNSIKHKNLL